MIETSAAQIGSGTVDPSQFSTVSIDLTENDLTVETSDFEDRTKGIRVRATGQEDITVLVAMRFSFTLTGYGTYLMHPIDQFTKTPVVSYEYYAVSYEYEAQFNQRSNFLLVGTEVGTFISITPTQPVQLPIDTQSQSSMANVAAGTTYTALLNQFQTLLVISDGDLTGSKIVSDKPLVVISGHQCPHVPVLNVDCEPIYAHIPPVLDWGLTFLLAPFAGRPEAKMHIKVIASKASTSVSYRCSVQGVSSIFLGEGDYKELVLESSFCHIFATEPIFVVQIASGVQEDSEGDPAMAIVAPVTGYTAKSTFYALPGNLFPNNFITVTVPKDSFIQSQIQLDGSQLPCTWSEIYDAASPNQVAGQGCTHAVTAGSHVVEHTGTDGALSVLVYGWNNNPPMGYAYLTAAILVPSGKYLA